MSRSIVLECPASDRSYFEQLAKEGHAVTIAEVERYEGVQQIIEVVVQLTAALSPILVAYISRPSEEKQAKKVVIDGQRRALINYTSAEIKEILRPD